MKTTKTRIISLLLVSLLILTCTPITETYAKSRVKMTKKLRMNQGSTYVLKLNGVSSKEKVKWTVGKKSVVKLSNKNKNKCKIKAKKPGTTYVRARYKGKTYKCKVTVVKKTDKNQNKTPDNVPDKTPDNTPDNTPDKTDSTEGDTDKTNVDNINEVTFNGKKYSLTFSDEFDTWDSSKWNYCPQGERQDVGGEWRNSCSKVENGNYVITCDVDENGTPISGGIRSKREHEQTFGLYHMRFKMEYADGLWYALWLYTDKMENSAGNGATDGAELDIIELVPHEKELCMSVHWDGYDDNLQTHCEVTHVDEDFYDRYHELWYIWDQDGYRLYMDGMDESCLLFDFSADEWGDGACSVPCDIVISSEYGTWGGPIDYSKLPAHFYVDYVRAYQVVDN